MASGKLLGTDDTCYKFTSFYQHQDPLFEGAEPSSTKEVPLKHGKGTWLGWLQLVLELSTKLYGPSNRPSGGDMSPIGAAARATPDN